MAELKNKFERSQNELCFVSKNYKNGKFVALAGGRMWQAIAEPRNPDMYEPIVVNGKSREALIGKLGDSMPGFRLIRIVDDPVHDEMDAIKSELEAARKAATEAPKPVPERSMFGLPESDPAAHAIARRELERFLQSHATEPNFVYSEFNARNLLRKLNEERDRGDWDSPTVERFEAAYQFLLANNCWEPKFRKRMQGAARPYWPASVQPKAAPEVIAAQQRAEALAERRRLEQMPLEDLRVLAENQRKQRLVARRAN
jgi:hypothetical protein